MVRHNRLIHLSGQQAPMTDDGCDQLPPSPSLAATSNATSQSQPLEGTWRAFDAGPGIEPESPIGPPVQLSNRPQESHAAVQPWDGLCVESSTADFDEDGMLQFALSEPLQDPMQDFNLFLGSIGLSPSWEPELISPVQPTHLTTDVSTAPESDLRQGSRHAEPCASPPLHADDVPYSTFGSRLPSLQPEARDSDGRNDRQANEPSLLSASSISNVRTPEYRAFIKRLEGLRDELPPDFILPSRWALARSLDGFIDGLNEHHPFIHAPTTSIERCSPALTLALAACGSQYRFEEARGFDFFYAARAILIYDLNGRKRFPFSLSAAHNLSERLKDHEAQDQDPRRLSIERQREREELAEHIQTFLLLTIFATWGKNQDILQALLSLQGVLASMIRDHGLSEDDQTSFTMTTDSDEVNWHRWVRQERDRRTKLAAFTMFNLHSIMYNQAPLIVSADLRLNLPCPSALWKAASAEEWRLAYEWCSRSATATGTPFQTSFALLFTRPPSLPTNFFASTPMGNHVLLHGIFQHIYFARQLCISPPPRQRPRQNQSQNQNPNSGLRSEDLAMLEDVLHAWKLRWEQTPESSTNPRNPAGPIAFTSAALLGQAYVHLYLDLGPCRALMSQDPVQIAQSLASAPPVERFPGLVMALLHAAHALSVPVRLGIDFVARSHSFHWSVQHSLVSLEYAFLLSRWLLALPGPGGGGSPKMSEREQLLFLWVKRMVDETQVARCAVARSGGLSLVGTVQGGCATTGESGEHAARMKQLGSSIVRIWVRTFKGNAGWGIVDLVGQSLEAYAELLEQS